MKCCWGLGIQKGVRCSQKTEPCYLNTKYTQPAFSAATTNYCNVLYSRIRKLLSTTMLTLGWTANALVKLQCLTASRASEVMWHGCQLDTHHAPGSHPSRTNWCVPRRVLAEKSALSARSTSYDDSPVPVYSLYAVGNGLKKVGGRWWWCWWWWGEGGG